MDTAGLHWALLYQEGLVCVYRSSPSDGLLSPEKRDPDDGMGKQASSWARTLGQLFSFLIRSHLEEMRRWRPGDSWNDLFKVLAQILGPDRPLDS